MIGGSNNIEQHGQFNGNSVQLSTASVVTARKDIFQSGDDNRRKIVRCFFVCNITAVKLNCLADKVS